DARYAYLAAPARDASAAEALATEPGVRVVHNDADRQVVRHAGGVVAAVLWEAGEVAVTDTITATLGSPAIALFIPGKDELRVLIADPTQKLESIELRLTGEWLLRGDESAGRGATFRLKLPQGDLGGSALSVRLARD
ncbi:MAG TPA: polysaccharide lyase beta-sandwich domain-containing protein, partial [Tepidisphaeraceae bacterium]|nr:polysaccharide lyase beta-sandwich domain-containing protein [Tepidisphaeraceae bacterium]